MQDEQAVQISEINESNILKFTKRGNEGNRYSRSKVSKQIPILKIILMAFLFLGFAGMIYKIFDLQKQVKNIQSGRNAEGKQSENSIVGGNAQLNPSDFNSLSIKVNQLEARVRKLAQDIVKLQKAPRPKAETFTNKPLANISSGNSTQLMEYFQSKFHNQQTWINFLHMHDSEVYYYQKVDFLKSILNTDLLRSYEKAKISFMQALGNYKIPHYNVHIQNEINDYHKKEQERLSREYDFNLPELPFCIVVPTLNNARNFRYEYNLQSMINLDYKNFKIVIVDDASTDYTYELIKLWIEENEVTHDIVVITNEKRRTAVPNIHKAVTEHCGADSIVVLADGDDELLGRYSLKVFNHLYQKQKSDVVYSNHIQFYTHTRQAYRGWSMNYGDDEKKNNRYRDVPQKIAHLRSFKAKLYLKIKQQDLKDKNGEWLTSTYDEVICLPILEMSCGRITYVEEFFYLYNFGIGTNDLQVDPVLQKNIADYVKFQKTKYQCVNQ